LSIFACMLGNDYICRIKGEGIASCTKKMTEYTECIPPKQADWIYPLTTERSGTQLRVRERLFKTVRTLVKWSKTVLIRKYSSFHHTVTPLTLIDSGVMMLDQTCAVYSSILVCHSTVESILFIFGRCFAFI